MEEQTTPSLDTTPEPPAWRWAWTPVEPRPHCRRFPKQEKLSLAHPAAPLPEESPEDRRKRRNRDKRIRRARRG
jgi:hypothetical protein